MSPVGALKVPVPMFWRERVPMSMRLEFNVRLPVPLVGAKLKRDSPTPKMLLIKRSMTSVGREGARKAWPMAMLAALRVTLPVASTTPPEAMRSFPGSVRETSPRNWTLPLRVAESKPPFAKEDVATMPRPERGLPFSSFTNMPTVSVGEGAEATKPSCLTMRLISAFVKFVPTGTKRFEVTLSWPPVADDPPAFPTRVASEYSMERPVRLMVPPFE